MRKIVLAALLGAIVTALASGSYAVAKGGGDNDDRGKNTFRTSLDGWQEDPSQVTTGRGHFRARLVDDDTIEFWLSYSGLEAPPTQAHIHIGSHHETGGVSAWLCGTGGTRAAGLPAVRRGALVHRDGRHHRPGRPGSRAAQHADLLRAMRHDEVYVNVHTPRAPAGEIRGDFGHDQQH